MFCKVPYERLQRLFVKSLAHPVKRRAEIIHQLFARGSRPDLSSKSTRFLYTWIGRLEPQQISKRGKFDGSLGRSWQSCCIVVESFSSPWNIPRKEDRGFGILGCKSTPPGDGEVSISFDPGSILFNIICICTL